MRFDQINFQRGPICSHWYHRAFWLYYWHRLIWWRQHREIVVAVDTLRGIVTTAPLRWSWRHWRWLMVEREESFS